MFSHFSSRWKVPGLVPIIFTLHTLGSVAQAGNTWTGGSTTNGDWTRGTNWSGGTTPSYGTLTFSGSTRTTNNNDFVSLNMNQINFASASDFTLNGNLIRFFDNGGTQAKIENNGSGLGTVNFPVEFAATAGTARAEINAVNGNLVIGNTVAITGSIVSEVRLYGSGRTVALNGVVSGSGKGLFVMGNNTVTLSASNTYSGDTIINQGTLQFGEGGSSNSSIIRVGEDASGNAATLSISDANGGTSANSTVVIRSGTGARTVSSTQTSGTNTFGGSFFLDGNLTTVSTVANTLMAISGTTVDLKAQTLTVSGSGNTRIAGVIKNSTGAGGIGKNDDGTLSLAGTSTYSGDTLIRGGTLQFEEGASANNSILRLGATSGTGSATLALADANGGSSIGSSIVVRAGSSGEKRMQSTNSSGTNTFSGNVTLDADVKVSTSAGGTVAMTGAVLDLKNQTLTVGGAGNTLISGALQNSTGSGKLTKTDAGSLTITGSHNYAGATTLSGGATTINGTISQSAITLQSGATLSGLGTIRSLSVESSGTFSPGSGTGALTLNGGNLTLGTGAVTNLAFTATNFGIGTFTSVGHVSGGTAEAVTFGGTLNLAFSPGTYDMNVAVQIFDFDSYSGTFSALNVSGLSGGQTAVFNASAGTLTVIPEPGCAAMLLSGFALLSAIRRPRQTRS